MGIPHVRDQRNTAGHEAAIRLRGARDLAPCLLAEDAPHVADVHTDLLEDGAAHEPGLAPALQTMAVRSPPAAGLEAARGLERLESGADARLQVAEPGRCGLLQSSPVGRLRGHVAPAPVATWREEHSCT